MIIWSVLKIKRFDLGWLRVTKKSTSFDKKLVDFYSSRKAWYVISPQAKRELPLGVCHFRLDYIQFYRIDFIPLRGLHTRYGVIKTRVQLTL